MQMATCRRSDGHVDTGRKVEAEADMQTPKQTGRHVAAEADM